MKNITSFLQKNYQILIFIYILMAPLSYHLLPYMGVYGSDLLMQFYFNNCSALSHGANNLYDLAGSMCNDAHNLYYAYPVLIFRFFSYAKLFNLHESFYYIWCGAIILTLLFQPFIWLKNKGPKFYKYYFAFGLISLIQAPSFFALERGGTDIIFIIPWTMAMFFGLKDLWIFSGIFMAIAALLKIYPVMAIAPIIFGLFLTEKNKVNFLKCALAIIATVIIAFAFDWDLWKIFVFEILPREAKLTIGTNTIGHSLIGPFSKFFVYPLMIGFWILFARLFAIKNNHYKKIAFAGTLALSTYFNGHSFDYNLIAVFPFIYLSYELYLDSESPLKDNPQVMWAVILLSLTLLGPANIIFGQFKFTNKIKLLIEIFAYALIPINILIKENISPLTGRPYKNDSKF